MRAARAQMGRGPVVLPVRHRRPGFIALGAVLIVGLGAVGAWLYAGAGAKTPVVMVATEVAAGEAIERSDLSTVPVAGGVRAIAASNLESVVGQHAAVTLLPGMLVQRSMVMVGSGLGSGQAEVGVVVTSGRVPAEGVRAGDTVQVARLPEAGGSGEGGSGRVAARELVGAARVFTVRADPAQAGATLVTLTVPASDALAVAEASGLGLIALVRVAAS